MLKDAPTTLLLVMPGTRIRPKAGPGVNLVPGIYALTASKTWMAGTSLAMTGNRVSLLP